MAEHARPRLSFWKHTNALWSAFEIGRLRKPYSKDAQEDTRSRREFLTEMLDRNPDTLSSEIYIQHMARLYRSKF